MISHLCKYYLVTKLDEIAWLLNLRGSDIVYNPVFFSYLLLKVHDYNSYTSDITLYVDEIKLDN
jgi:Xaa-Pro aminopeptidase